MKKNLLILLLVAFIVPSIASASWWNPFSWNFFHRKEKISQIIPLSNASSTNDSVPTKGIEKNKFVEIFKKEDKNIADKDYHDLIGNLYYSKIAFLDKQISLFSLFTDDDPIIKEKQEDISFHKSWLDKYAKLAMDKSAIDLNLKTYEAIVFWNQEIDMRKSVSEIYKYRVKDLESLKNRLNEELVVINKRDFISETEYKFRLNILNGLINEDKFSEQYTEQDKNINNLLDKYNKLDAEYLTILKTMTLNAKEENDKALAKINAELLSLKNTPVPTVQVAPIIQSQPTSIQCQKTYQSSGYPSTRCTEYPSMKSMTCNTSYDVNRNESKNCYFY